MDIVSQYMLISFVLAIIFIVLAGQSVLLSRVHKTVPWSLFAVGWLLIGGRQTYAMLKIPLALEELRARGIPVQPIDLEGWLMILSGGLAGIIFIIGHDILRRHYQSIGV